MIDRATIIATIPSENALRAMPAHGQKSTAEDLVGRVLDAIDAGHRDPDAWEADLLATAIGYITTRWYFASINSSVLAMAPPEERSPKAVFRQPEPHRLRDLRDALAYASGMPAPNY